MDSVPSPIYTSAFYPVRMYEADPEGRATIISLINYFQEAAALHARILGFHPDNLKKFGIGWVLSRLCLQVERYPLAEEKVRVITWLLPPRHRTAFRDFQLEDAQGHTIARCTSAWPVMDLTTRRMTDLPEALLRLIPQKFPQALEFPSRTIAKLTVPLYSASITPRFSDLDFNHHVNNVHFVAWALEALPHDFRRTHTLSRLDIIFRSEITQSTSITTACAPSQDAPLTWQHSLTRASDLTETARLTTVWSDKETILPAKPNHV